MSTLRGAVVGSLVLATGLALAAPTTTVVDVPSGGAIQRFLYVRPDAPVANIVSIPGGDGVLGIQDDGTMTTGTAICGPVSRNRDAFAARGFSVALVDKTSTGSVYGFDDILEVVRYMQARDPVPTWVIGGSASTAAVANLAINLPYGAVGAIFFSPQSVSASRAAMITRPTLVVFHTSDPLQSGSQLYNRLTAAPVKDRVALAGGSNAGCGYHLFNGLDAEFVAAVAGFIDQHNGSFATPPQTNYGGLWWTAPGGSESGWGINFAHQGDLIFATWYTYDVNGKAWWLTMTAQKSAAGVYGGTLYQHRGPAFNAVPFTPSTVTATAVGNGTLTFSDKDNATFAYTVNGVSQQKAITKTLFGPQPTCTFGAQPNLSLATNFQDIWWAAPGGVESGWGVNFTHQGDLIFAAWFTYDVDGSPLWLTATLGKTAPMSYTGTLYRSTGPAFSAVPFLPANVVLTAVGTLTLTFAHGNSATYAYTVSLAGPGSAVTQQKTIERTVFDAPGTVCQ